MPNGFLRQRFFRVSFLLAMAFDYAACKTPAKKQVGTVKDTSPEDTWVGDGISFICPEAPASSGKERDYWAAKVKKDMRQLLQNEDYNPKLVLSIGNQIIEKEDGKGDLLSVTYTIADGSSDSLNLVTNGPGRGLGTFESLKKEV